MYDKKNLEAIEKSIEDMQSGRRVVGASYGETRVQYANLTLSELINLRNRIRAGIESSDVNAKRQVRFITSKGLA
jgi:hypothetical protein